MHTILSKVAHLHAERVVSSLQWTALALLVLLYVYYIVLSVTNVVLRQELTMAIEHEETRIGELETKYLTYTSTLTEAVAHELGFVAVQPLAYVPVEEQSGRLSRVD